MWDTGNGRPAPRPRRPLLRGQHRNPSSQPRRPLDRHLEASSPPALWNADTEPAPLLPRPRHEEGHRGELQPGRQLDPHRQRGRHRPRTTARSASRCRASKQPLGRGSGLCASRRQSAERSVPRAAPRAPGEARRGAAPAPACRPRSEELVLQPPGTARAQLAEHLLAVGCEADEMATPVVRAALALDERLLPRALSSNPTSVPAVSQPSASAIAACVSGAPTSSRARIA